MNCQPAGHARHDENQVPNALGISATYCPATPGHTRTQLFAHFHKQHEHTLKRRNEHTLRTQVYI
jgi:hypothetical protein